MKNVISFVVLMTLTVSGNLFAAEFHKANNTSGWNGDGSWVENAQPADASDTIIYDNTVTGANNSNLGKDFTIGMLKITNPGGFITIRDNTLNIAGIGGIGIDMSQSTQNLVLNTTVNATALQTWYLGGKMITFQKLPTNLFTNVTVADSGILASNQAVTYSANTPWTFSGTWRQVTSPAAGLTWAN